VVVASSWWATQLNPQGLSQGDIISAVPLGAALVPVTFLGRDTWPNRGKDYWPQSPTFVPYKTDSTGLFIARGRVIRGLVVSHNCELDDKPDKTRVLLAPVYPIDQVTDPTARSRILNQERSALLPLPGLGGYGDHYADLRLIAHVDRKLIPNASREFSMNDDAVIRLRAQLIAFFTRIDMKKLAGMREALEGGLREEDQPPQ
jgi:hypothetical protein